MRIVQFDMGRVGIVEDNSVFDVTDAVQQSARYPFPRHDTFIEKLPALRSKIDAARSKGTPLDIRTLRLNSPVSNPGKIIAAPVNYLAHLEEARADPSTFSAAHVRRIEETGLFLKATSSLVGAGSEIEIKHPDRRTDHEIELVAIIGERCSDVRREDALRYVAGYSIGLDITVRGPEERSLRKSIDTYSVVGPWMVTADELADPSGLELALTVNGEPRQRANTRDLIMDVSALIAFASSFYTLEAGDLLFTGTPEGVGPIVPGDLIRAQIEGLGELSVRVAAST